MSRGAAVKWVARQDKTARKLEERISRMVLRLTYGKPLSKADSWWLMDFLVRFANGKDVRAELYKPAKARGRAAGSEQDLEVYMRYSHARDKGLSPKKAIGETAVAFKLADGSIDRIIRRVRKNMPELDASMDRILKSRGLDQPQ